jgi:hypothetical protein
LQRRPAGKPANENQRRFARQPVARKTALPLEQSELMADKFKMASIDAGLVIKAR